jgi:hypothetical protein
MDEPAVGQRARIGVEYRETHDGHGWLGATVLLIDGNEIFSQAGSGGYIGLPPVDLASQQPLLQPSETSQAVRLYRCDCGELGCGTVVARCYRLLNDVIWDRFDSGNPPPIDLASPRPSEDALVFTAEDYEAFTSRLAELAARHPDAA